MKAIKIPNSALLDVLGRPVAINSQDLHRTPAAPRPPKLTQIDKNSTNNLINGTGNGLGPTPAPPPVDPEDLTVIGKYMIFLYTLSLININVQLCKCFEND